MSETDNELVRPSSLPKLAECRCYKGKAGSSEAALRGTRLDAAIRDAWAAGGPLGVVVPESDDAADVEDAEACNWAVYQLAELSGGYEVLTREEDLRAVVPVEGIKAGTMDGLCVRGGWLCDYKTGQPRNYREQMAAYALACMDMYHEDRWTAHVLYIDRRERVTYVFTRAEAEAIVRGVLERPKVPTCCEYCEWCERSATGCAAVDAACERALEAPAESLEELAADEQRAWQYLRDLKVAQERGESLRGLLREREGLDPRWFKRVQVSGRKVLKREGLAELVRRWGVEAVEQLLPAVDLGKVAALWEEREGGKPLPEDWVGLYGATTQLRLGTGKEPKGKRGGAA